MPELVLTDALISIGGNDLSDHFTSVTLEYSADVQESTAFGDEFRTRVGGLKDWSLIAYSDPDFYDGQLDNTLYSLLGTNLAIIIRPYRAQPVGVNNPQYSGNAILESYPPLGNPFRYLVTGSISLLGNGTLARAVV